MRWDDGVGEPGLEVDGCSIVGHTDLLQAANAHVIGSMRMDPVAQAITGGDHAAAPTSTRIRSVRCSIGVRPSI